MPLRNATPYMVSPRCTLIVLPYFGWDAARVGEDETVEADGSRTTVLLQETSATTEKTVSRADDAWDAILDFMRFASPAVCLPYQPADQQDEHAAGDPADRFYPAMQCRFGTRAAQPDRAGDKIQSLAAADEHAGHER